MSSSSPVFFFAGTFRSFVRNRLKTFCHLFVLGHFFVWLKKSVMTELTWFFSSFQTKIGQSPNIHQKNCYSRYRKMSFILICVIFCETYNLVSQCYVWTMIALLFECFGVLYNKNKWESKYIMVLMNKLQFQLPNAKINTPFLFWNIYFLHGWCYPKISPML